MKIIEGSKNITKAIGSIKNRGAKLDKDIYICACSCLMHIEQHGDVTLLNNLIQAMPKGSRVNALRDWASCYGKVKYNSETKEFQYSKDKTTLVDEMKEKSWIEFKPESVYKPLNFEKDMQRILKMAYSRIDSEKGDKINPELLGQVAKAFGYIKEV